MDDADDAGSFEWPSSALDWRLRDEEDEQERFIDRHACGGWRSIGNAARLRPGDSGNISALSGALFDRMVLPGMRFLTSDSPTFAWGPTRGMELESIDRNSAAVSGLRFSFVCSF